MPQVHNKNVNDTCFGKDSRYMTSMRFSDVSLRRVNVQNALEHRLEAKKVNFYENDSAYKLRRMDRVKLRLQENMTKRMAYKLVLKSNSISESKNYEQALNKRYSFTAFHGEVKEMMKFMKPERVRERKANLMLKENRLKYEILISQNRQKFNKLVPEKRTWIPRHLQAQYEAEEKEKQEKAKEEAAKRKTKVEDKFKRGLATLRRRIITLDSAPASPTKSPAVPKHAGFKTPVISSPTKTPVPVNVSTPVVPEEVKTPAIGKPPQSPSQVKRQGITMSMMKRQKSFLERQERTMSPTTLEQQSLEAEKDNNTQSLADIVSKATDMNNNSIETTSAIPQNNQDKKDKGNASKRKGSINTKVPILPPIDSNKTPRDGLAALPGRRGSIASSVGKESSKATKLPALKMTKK